MSNARRVIPLVLDVEAAARRTVTGGELTPPDSKQGINLYYGTQCLFRAELLAGAPNVHYEPAAGATFLFGIDDRYDADHADLVLSENDQFNIDDDWEAVFPPGGKISFRANLATTELKAALDTLASSTGAKTMFCYLWMTPPGEVGNVLLATWPVTMWRVAVDPTTAVAVEGITHLTTTAAAAAYVPLWGDGAYERRKDGRTQHLFPDGKWRAQIAVLVDGQPTLTWGDPED